MNTAHWHLIVNHLPIVGGGASFFVFLYALLRRNEAIITLGYLLFVLTGVSSIIASQTGESAEHYLKRLNMVDETILETHVRAADVANYAMIAVAIAALVALVIKKFQTIRFIPWIVILLAAIAVSLMVRAGNLGGAIMHKEIRTDAINVSIKKQE